MGSHFLGRVPSRAGLTLGVKNVFSFYDLVVLILCPYPMQLCYFVEILPCRVTVGITQVLLLLIIILLFYHLKIRPIELKTGVVPLQHVPSPIPRGNWLGLRIYICEYI